MSPLRAGGAGCPGDASAEKTTSVAAATPDATPAVVTPALRKSRRVVFMFEPPKYLLHVLVWPSAGQIRVFHWVNYSLRSAQRSKAATKSERLAQRRKACPERRRRGRKEIKLPDLPFL